MEQVTERLLPHRSDRRKTPVLEKYRTLTREEILALKPGDNLYYWADSYRGPDKAANIRVNGKVRTWKTRPGLAEIPLKYGMRDCFTLTMYEALTFLMKKVDS